MIITRLLIFLLALTLMWMAAPLAPKPNAGLFSSSSVFAATTFSMQTDAHQEVAGQLAEHSREAAGEDENAQFKQSPSVKLLARMTGLSLEHAYLLSVLLNFAIIAGAVIFLLKKKLPGVFRDRTNSIQKAMAEARVASEDANRRLADIEARLSKLGGEIQQMQVSADKEAVAEEVRIQAAAEEDARKIVESATQEIAAATKNVRRELKAYAADLAVALARRQIRVDDATDHSLINGFAQKLTDDGGRDGSHGKVHQ
ncbi:MAG: ATP synthase F0 subunit B [Acidobacteriota bacterium]|nr:ATP synthase F0 subunit B [Acidobacteriota bacterium]